MYQPTKSRVLIALLLSPILATLVVFLSSVVISIFDVASREAIDSISDVGAILAIFLLMGVLIGCPIMVIIIFPLYMTFEKYGIKHIGYYILCGAVCGATAYYFLVDTYIESYAFSGAWGVLSTVAFWFILRPDRTRIGMT